MPLSALVVFLLPPELYRATSAVGYAIKTLESSLDVEIYDRSGHKAVLTEGGRLILEEGRAVLERARQLEKRPTILTRDGNHGSSLSWMVSFPCAHRFKP